ncbi:MAG: tetratricopeptide repeat protein, partial [Thermoleophilaceae bacterium]|nr:tetratricopeptide repeat protein [Thermoleophilaceae bacterium]
RRGDLAAARTTANSAVDAAPWAASPRMQRALVAEADGRLRDAREDLRETTDKQPQDWRGWALLARVQAESRQAEEARKSFRRARRLRPGSPFFIQRPRPVPVPAG